MPEHFFKLEIVTPTRMVFSGDVKHVRAPGVAGYFGVLAHHIPFVAPIKIGIIEVNVDSTTINFTTSGGFVEVFDNTMTILAETAERVTEIDVDRAQNAKERALKRLHDKTSDIDVPRARLALARALNRLEAASRT